MTIISNEDDKCTEDCSIDSVSAYTTSTGSNSLYPGGPTGSVTFGCTCIAWPCTCGIVSAGTTTFVTTATNYTVFKLPKSVMPNKVYLSGRLITVGMLGTDVQAAYDGKNKLIIAPGEVNAVQYGGKLTVAWDYGDWLYHYNINSGINGEVLFEDDSNIISCKQVSKAKQA